MPRPKRPDPHSDVHLRLNSETARYIKNLAKRNKKSLSDTVDQVVREWARDSTSKVTKK